MWTLFAGGTVLLAGAFFLVVDAVSHSNKKNSDRMESFNNLTSRNKARRRRREYQDIIDDETLNWQEKYKKYAQRICTTNRIHNKLPCCVFQYLCNISNSPDWMYIGFGALMKKAFVRDVFLRRIKL